VHKFTTTWKSPSTFFQQKEAYQVCIFFNKKQFPMEKVVSGIGNTAGVKSSHSQHNFSSETNKSPKLIVSIHGNYLDSKFQNNNL